MVHIIKVYFTSPKQNVQIRRLAVNSDVVSRFDLLSRKIREMFPGFAQGHIEVTWKDSENDVIHMSSDEELAQALASADDDILRIYAYSTDNQQCDENENQNFKSSHNAVHQNVICDGCDKTIQGYRYKCLQCPNFDLCSACNAANRHENHDMIKLVRPTHISREWVFPGARKIWRSMFGRCPQSYFTALTSANENEKAEKSDPKKNQWPGILDDLLKGSCVSADKIIKDNLGNFMNFLESVSGNLDIKIEGDPPKSTHCTRKHNNKNDQKTNNGSPNAESTSTTAPCPPAEPELKECSESVVPETEGQSSNSASSNVSEKEQKENASEPCGLFGTHDAKASEGSDPAKAAIEVASMLMKSFMGENFTSAAGDSTEQKQAENLAKPCGLFGDNESSDGWTILNKQEADKNDAKSVNDTGAKPKYPSLYPLIFEKTESCEAPQANAETQPKEVVSKQSDNPQVLPKPVAKAETDADKRAKLDQNQNFTPCNDPEIMNALMKMQAMGFTNEGGWLERLLITKDGNINATLDALYPNTRRR